MWPWVKTMVIRAVQIQIMTNQSLFGCSRHFCWLVGIDPCQEIYWVYPVHPIIFHLLVASFTAKEQVRHSSRCPAGWDGTWCANDAGGFLLKTWVGCGIPEVSVPFGWVNQSGYNWELGVYNDAWWWMMVMNVPRWIQLGVTMLGGECW